MRLTLEYGLPFVAVTLVHRQAEIEVSHVLVDTGSARTMFAADMDFLTRTEAIINLHRLQLEFPSTET